MLAKTMVIAHRRTVLKAIDMLLLGHLQVWLAEYDTGTSAICQLRKIELLYK